MTGSNPDPGGLSLQKTWIDPVSASFNLIEINTGPPEALYRGLFWGIYKGWIYRGSVYINRRICVLLYA
jgi:hypothetical protein